MKFRYFTIPNMLTLANLLCGSLAIVHTLDAGDLKMSFWFIMAAAVFDFLDGMAARLLGSYSPLGKELDSLADVVSFGVAPASAAYVMCMDLGGGGLSAAVFVIALFSALRLARFNIDPGQSEGFTGLPTPANAIFFASLGWLYADGAWTVPAVWTVVAAAVMSLLLISPVRMFSLKFHGFSLSDRNNVLRYLFLLAALAALAALGIAALPAIIPAYIAVSAITTLACKKRG